MEVDHFSKVLSTCLVDVTALPNLMLDFNCGIKGVPTINITNSEVKVYYPPLKGNIADDPEDNIEMPTTAPGPSNCHQTVQGESFQDAAPPHMDSDPVQGTSLASALGIIPTTSLASDKQQFSPRFMGRLKALMSKENRTQTLITVGAEEASTCFNAHASQDEASYDDDISDEEEDIEVVPDEVADTQIKGSKPAETISVADKEVPKATNKEDGSQTSKSAGKNPVRQHSNKASSGTRDGLVCYNWHILTDGCKDKYPKDHISVHCVQRAGRVLMSCFDMLKEKQKMSNIFFHLDMTLANGSTLQGGKWPSVPWYPDTPETGVAL